MGGKPTPAVPSLRRKHKGCLWPSPLQQILWSQEPSSHLAPGKGLESITSGSIRMLPEAGGEMGSPGTWLSPSMG